MLDGICESFSACRGRGRGRGGRGIPMGSRDASGHMCRCGLPAIQ